MASGSDVALDELLMMGVRVPETGFNEAGEPLRSILCVAGEALEVAVDEMLCVDCMLPNKA